MVAPGKARPSLAVHAKMLEEIFDTIPMAVLAKDLDGNILIGNRAAAEFLGIDKETISTLRAETMGIESDESNENLEEMYADDQRILETGEIIEREWPMIFQDGRSGWFHVTKGPFRDHKGNVAGFVAIWRNISEERATREQLRESESLYRTLVEGSVQGMMVATDKTYLFANEASARILGYDSPQELIGLEVARDLIAPPDRDRAKRFVQARMRGEDIPTHYEAQGLKKDGTTIWLDCISKKISWNGADTIQTTYTDISDRKRTEAELTARKLESISTLAKGIAGEVADIFNRFDATIMRARMESYAQGVERISEILNETTEISEQAQELVNQLLILCRGGEPAKQPVSVADLIAEVLPKAVGRGKIVPISRRKITVKLTVDAELPIIQVDREQIRQVLNSLFQGGLNAMPNGGTLAVTAENYELKSGKRTLNLPPGKYVKISVKDQGPGLANSDLERIFDPYYAVKNESAGTGLGGAYSIVKNHSGAMTAHSKPGRGSRFTVYLPV